MRILFAAVFLTSGCAQAPIANPAPVVAEPGLRTPAAGAPVIKTNGHLFEKDGQPWTWVGDTAWRMTFELDAAEIDRYFQDRDDKGFNVIQGPILVDRAGDFPLAAGAISSLRTDKAGNAPLLSLDPVRLNDRYWQSVDYIVEKALEHGMFIVLTPVWGSDIDQILVRMETWDRFTGTDGSAIESHVPTDVDGSGGGWSVECAYVSCSRVTASVVTVQSNHLQIASTASHHMAVTDCRRDDCRVEFDWLVGSNSGQRLAIAVRRADKNDEVWVSLREPEDDCNVYSVVAGRQSSILSSGGSAAIDTSNTYHVLVDVYDSVIRLFVDGAIRCTAAAFPARHDGATGVGVGVADISRNVAIDNVKVWHPDLGVAADYTRQVVARYRAYPNVIWSAVGEFQKAAWMASDRDRSTLNRDEIALISTVAETIDAYKHPDSLATTHTDGATTSCSQWHGASWLQFCMLQSYDSVARSYSNITLDFARSSPIVPTVEGESYYEGAAAPDAWRVRIAAYVATFAGSAGYTYGHSDIWRFSANWRTALDATAGSDMQWYAKLMADYHSTDRVPDQALITSGVGSIRSSTFTACTRNGTYSAALCYSSNGTTFHVATRNLKGLNRVRARWYDPRAGSYTPIDDCLLPSYDEAFDPPGRPANANDWVLVLDAGVVDPCNEL